MTTAPNTDQFDAWNGDSGHRWVATADRRDAVLAPIGDLLLADAAIPPGDAVLDIGCGCGATSLAAAIAAGPDGAVVGLDLSEPMLDVARRRAVAAGLPHLQFSQGDAQVHRLEQTFDVAISRFGTMFFDDPVAAFTNLARHLRPDGRLCIATWQPLVANQWLTVPGAALLRYGTLPETDGPSTPGMFAQADPVTIRSVLTSAGFVGIDSTPHTAPLCLGATIDDAVDHLADSGPGRAVLETVPEDERAAALAAVAEVLASHHHNDTGAVLDAAVWITTARIAGEGPEGQTTSTSSFGRRAP
jgi:SAM-dependent methyltransferase